jgi:hypothetical protein
MRRPVRGECVRAGGKRGGFAASAASAASPSVPTKQVRVLPKLKYKKKENRRSRPAMCCR